MDKVKAKHLACQYAASAIQTISPNEFDYLSRADQRRIKAAIKEISGELSRRAGSFATALPDPLALPEYVKACSISGWFTIDGIRKWVRINRKVLKVLPFANMEQMSEAVIWLEKHGYIVKFEGG